jgi:hypothetical protein
MQFFGMSGTDKLLVILFAILAALIVARLRRHRSEAMAARARRAADGGLSAERAPSDGALVAVITAAIVAANGNMGSFRITGIEPTQDAARPGFNTPVWGHADRLARSLTR